MLFRAYINAKKGNEHVRVLDVEISDALAESDARDAAMEEFEGDLKKGEVVGDVVRIHEHEPHAFDAETIKVRAAAARDT